MMINYNIIIGVILMFVGKSCATKSTFADMDMQQAQVMPQDSVYANVFKSLDGTWQGEFIIYEVEGGQQEGRAPTDGLSLAYLNTLPVREQNRISVKQIYQSLSPYYQKVEIEDTYTQAGERITVKSYGVNKIEKGEMWCVVQKPNEKIIHRGQTDGHETIIWSRNKSTPLNIEYFRETVLPKTYEIIGYGYYGTDDPQKAPKTWFHGHYMRSLP